MTAHAELIEDAGVLRSRFIGDDGYGLVYGSHGSGTAGATSDLDLILISTARLSAYQIAQLVDSVCDLHRRRGLTLDCEVAHEVKLHATVRDVVSATSLSCFPISAAGDIEVPVVQVDPVFLNSDEFRLRLILNALTSPHVFLGGLESLYVDHRQRAEEAVGLLALSLHDRVRSTVVQAAEALLAAPDGAVGEDFLGYQHVDHLVALLRRSFAALARRGVVEQSGEVLAQNRQRRRMSLLATRGPVATAMPVPLRGAEKMGRDEGGPTL